MRSKKIAAAWICLLFSACTAFAGTLDSLKLALHRTGNDSLKLLLLEKILTDCPVSENHLYDAPMLQITHRYLQQHPQSDKENFWAQKRNFAIGCIRARFQANNESKKDSLFLYGELQRSQWIQDDYNYAALTKITAEKEIKKGNLVQALEIYNKAIQFFEKRNYLRGKAALYQSLGNLYTFEVLDTNMAFQYYKKMLRGFEDLGEKATLIKCYLSLGQLYGKVHKPQEGLYYLQLAKKGGMPPKVYESSLVFLFLDNAMFDSAHYYARRRQSDYAEAQVYKGEGNWRQAMEYYQKELQTATEPGRITDPDFLAGIYTDMGEINRNLTNHKQARECLEKAEKLARENNLQRKLTLIYRQRMWLEEASGNYKQAFAYQKLLAENEKKFGDDWFVKRTMAANFEHSLALQQEQEKANELKRKNTRWIFTISLSALLLILVLVLLSFRNKLADNKRIAEQKRLVEQKNTEILDSIEYAKRIQTAILPPPRIVKEFLKNSFVLYLPKDIVAGDFYWMDSVEDTIFFAACDCTGHGVPGAMVSVVCNNALNRAVNEFGERVPGKILDKTRELVLENFERSDEEVHDGMDASLCALHTSTLQLQWSGANNPLWICRSGSRIIEEVKPDKQAIGRGYEGRGFTTQELQLQKGDTLYLFTDGYADQFGGEKGKKMTKARFREFLLSIAEMNMEQQREKLLNFHDAYRGPLEQVDDICVIGVRV